MVTAKRIDEVPELDERGFLRHLDDLKKGYQATLKDWRARREALRSKIQAKTTIPFDDLQKRKYREERRRLKEELPHLYVQLKEIGEIIGGLEYIVEWLNAGREPGRKRGIERRSVYQRTVYMDPAMLERYIRPTNSRSASTLTEEQQHQLREVLDILSPREREVFEMHYGQGLSHSEIALMLNLPVGAVNTLAKRAHDKVDKGWQGTLF